MTEHEVMAELVRFVGVLTYGKERWFKQNGCWYDRMFGDCIQNEVFLERITEAINDEIADRQTTDCTKFLEWIKAEVLDEENWELNAVANGEVICRKFKKMGWLDVEDGYYVDTRPTGEWTDNHNGTFTCDQCGCKHSKSNFCPNCGAKMERR